MDSGLNDFQSLPFPSDGRGLNPSGRYYVFSLRRQTWTFSIIYSHLSLDLYFSYICTFNLMAINVACVLNVKKSISVFKVGNTKIGLVNAMQCNGPQAKLNTVECIDGKLMVAHSKSQTPDSHTHMGILVSIFKHEISLNRTLGGFKLKLYNNQRRKERWVTGIMLPLMLYTRPNTAFVKSRAPESCLGQAWIFCFFQKLESREPNP